MEAVPQHRVVVTGIGIVSPLGVGVERTWRRLLDGDVGTSASEEPPASGLQRFSGRVPEDEWSSVAEMYETQIGSSVKGTRCILFALAAADEAMRAAGLNPKIGDPDWSERAGVCIGTGIGSIDILSEASLLVASKPRAHRRLSPFFVPRTLLRYSLIRFSIQRIDN